MPPTTIRGKQVTDGTIQRADLDTSTAGQAVVAKIVQGTNITLSSTGADSGTGDVTISASSSGIPDAPSDGTSYGRQSAAWVRVVLIAGDTMSGPLGLVFNPNAPNGNVTLSSLYVDNGGTARPPASIGFNYQSASSPCSLQIYYSSSGLHVVDKNGVDNVIGDTSGNLLPLWANIQNLPASFTPSAHKTTHVTGGSDVIPAPTTSASGLVPALPTNRPTGKFLRGDASFAYPPLQTMTTAAFTMPAYGATVSVSVDDTSWMEGGTFLRVPLATAGQFQYMTVSSITNATTVVLTNSTGPTSSGTVAAGTLIAWANMFVCGANYPGIVPTPPNDTTKYFRGDGTWAAVGTTKTYSRFAAGQGNPPATNYAIYTIRNNNPLLAFDAATEYSIYFLDVMPENANLASGLLIRILWVPATAASGNCIWGAQIERMNTSIDADSFDTAGTVTTTVSSSTIPTVSQITLTTIDGVTAGDPYRLKIYRDAANASDTMAGDAQLISVEVRSAA